mgnify:CR=1 FL=1
MATNDSMNRIERESEQTLNVANRIERVAASDALMDLLKQIPTSVKQTYDTVPKKVVWAVAASIALLIVLNVVSAKNYSEEKVNSQTEQTNSYFDYLKTV